MDTDVARTALGDSGLAGIGLALVGAAVLLRRDRRIALGTLAIVLGGALVGHGLVGSFLDSMGMEYDDLY
jgi:hypothetical protein